MNVHTHGNGAARVGARLGRVWLGYLRQEARITRWLKGHGISRVVSATMLWIVKLSVFAILLYVGFWIAVVLLAVLIAAGGALRADEEEQPKWLEKDPDDHRDDLFYHPLSYNDDPDPRFDDPRHRDK